MECHNGSGSPSSQYLILQEETPQREEQSVEGKFHKRVAVPIFCDWYAVQAKQAVICVCTTLYN